MLHRTYPWKAIINLPNDIPNKVERTNTFCRQGNLDTQVFVQGQKSEKNTNVVFKKLSFCHDFFTILFSASYKKVFFFYQMVFLAEINTL